MTRAAQNLLSPSHLRDHPWGSATTQTCVYLLHGLEGSVTPLVTALHLEMAALMSGQGGRQQWQQGLCAPWKWHLSGAAAEQWVAGELLRCQPWPRHALSSHRLCSACLGTAGIASSPVQLPSSPQSRSGFAADPGLPAVSQPPRARCRDHQHQAVSGQAPAPLFPHPRCPALLLSLPLSPRAMRAPSSLPGMDSSPHHAETSRGACSPLTCGVQVQPALAEAGTCCPCPWLARGGHEHLAPPPISSSCTWGQEVRSSGSQHQTPTSPTAALWGRGACPVPCRQGHGVPQAPGFLSCL